MGGNVRDCVRRVKGDAISPACVAAGVAVKAVKAEMNPFHLEGLREGGEPVPGAESVVEWVEV
jgi:hypothetical protein